MRKRSREIEATIGTTMIVRIKLAVKTLEPVVWALPKIGMKPKVPCSQGSMSEWTNGARTISPQKPRMTLGIAASISTRGAITRLTPVGASRLRKSPIEMPIGVAKSSAVKEVTAVPKSSEAAPSCLKFGCQTELVRKPSPKWEMAGAAPLTTL